MAHTSSDCRGRFSPIFLEQDMSGFQAPDNAYPGAFNVFTPPEPVSLTPMAIPNSPSPFMDPSRYKTQWLDLYGRRDIQSGRRCRETNLLSAAARWISFVLSPVSLQYLPMLSYPFPPVRIPRSSRSLMRLVIPLVSSKTTRHVGDNANPFDTESLCEACIGGSETLPQHTTHIC